MTQRSTRNRAARLAVASLFCSVAFAAVADDRRPGMDGKTFGAPPAEVTEETYRGPAVVGDALTLAPALAPLAPGNRTHAVRLDIVVRDLEIADGVRYRAWTFGGSVPGPVLHVREGDRVEFTMRNRSEESVEVGEPVPGGSPFLWQLAERGLQRGTPAVAPMPHSMDFHAGTVAPTDKWRPIQPGQTIRFAWTANYPGVFLYHCGQPPVLMHAAMGQYGVVVVSPRSGYPTDGEVDREFVVVQSEFYLAQSEGGEWAMDFPAALAKNPSHVLFNGHAQSMLAAPLLAGPGERVRIYVHNAGPNDTSSFHVIGAIFDRVYYEGNPANEMRGMQTVLLGASNGAVVELVMPEAGEYPFVDHEFADATKGAVGKIRVGSVAPSVTMDSH